MNDTPFTKPKLTIREVLIWVVAEREITLEDLSGEYGISLSNAGVRLLKLYKGGYLSRRKPKKPPRVFRYRPTKLGRDTVRKWKNQS